MLFQRKISKLLNPTLKSENCKGENVKEDSKCYAEMIRIFCVCLKLIFITGIGIFTCTIQKDSKEQLSKQGKSCSKILATQRLRWLRV